MKILLDGPDLISGKPSRRDWVLLGVRDALLMALRKQAA